MGWLSWFFEDRSGSLVTAPELLFQQSFRTCFRRFPRRHSDRSSGCNRIGKDNRRSRASDIAWISAEYVGQRYSASGGNGDARTEPDSYTLQDERLRLHHARGKSGKPERCVFNRSLVALCPFVQSSTRSPGRDLRTRSNSSFCPYPIHGRNGKAFSMRASAPTDITASSRMDSRSAAFLLDVEPACRFVRTPVVWHDSMPVRAIFSARFESHPGRTLLLRRFDPPASEATHFGPARDSQNAVNGLFIRPSYPSNQKWRHRSAEPSDAACPAAAPWPTSRRFSRNQLARSREDRSYGVRVQCEIAAPRVLSRA